MATWFVYGPKREVEHTKTEKKLKIFGVKELWSSGGMGRGEVFLKTRSVLPKERSEATKTKQKLRIFGINELKNCLVL